MGVLHTSSEVRSLKTYKTLLDVAKVLNTSKSTLYKYVKSGLLFDNIYLITGLLRLRIPQIKGKAGRFHLPMK